MADTFKGIITADGKKRQLPYENVLKTPISDKTLSVQGGFADAKVVGVKFKEAKTKTDSLKEDLNDLTTDYKHQIPFVIGGFYEQGQINPYSANRCRTDIILNPNENKKIYCNSGYKFRLIYYTDNSEITSSSTPSSYHSMSDWYSGENEILPNQNYYTRLLVGYVSDANISDVSDFAENITIVGTGKVKENSDKIANLEATKLDVSSIYSTKDCTFSFVLGQGLSEAGVVTSSDTRTRTGIIHDGTTKMTLTCSDGIKIRPIYYHNNSANMSDDFDHLGEWLNAGESVTLEQNMYCRLLAGYADDATISSISDFNDGVIGKEEINKLDEILSKPLAGKKLSLLGDSISSYVGTIPSGNDVYYTGSNSGVSSPNQMWWSVLCEKTGMTPLVINGWSGSAITQLTDSAHSSKVPMSDISRCQALHTSDDYPDVIIVAGGVNDYSYANSQAHNPINWDGKTSPVKGNSFGETYACMIKDMQAAYPKAIIICLSTWFTMRGTDNGYTLINGTGYTQSDYDKEIENVCEIMRVHFVNVEKCGFNRSNFYPTYAEDSETIPTHPNAKGQAVMGKYLADIIPQLVNAFVN